MQGSTEHRRRAHRGVLFAFAALGLAFAVSNVCLTHHSLVPALQARADAKPSLRNEGEMPTLDGSTGWLNSAALNRHELRGKVVLISFWTYSCINWRRTLPYLRAWEAKYRDRGLVIVGVHSPEFEFEKDSENVRWAIHAMHIDYPVAMDSNFTIWRAFNNQYWPALYLVDVNGQIRFHQFGEGQYEKGELVIRQLLAESGHPVPDGPPASVQANGIEAPADWNNVASPENYVGFERTEGFSSPGGMRRGQSVDYSSPGSLAVNSWGLFGNWTADRESIRLNHPGGRIVYRFHARDLHLVMGPDARGRTVRFRILLDGKPPGASHGEDIDEQGNGTVSEQRLYQLIRQDTPIRDRQIEIDFLDEGVEAYSFTFG